MRSKRLGAERIILLGSNPQRTAQRSQGDKPSYDWIDADDADVLTLWSFSKRSAITLRNAQVERSGTTRLVPVLQVTIAHVTTWWMTSAAR
jgi:hypothetical protein